MHLEKKTQPKKNQDLGKKLMVLAKKKTSGYRDLTVIALHREQKNPQKSPKKLRKIPKKLTLPGFDRL